MKALITGSSSGMGMDMARYLASMGWSLILVARRKDRLLKLKASLNVPVKIICLDLSDVENVYKLYDMVKNMDIDLLINNAGFGVFGKFLETDLALEEDMLNVNVLAYHVLTKLFLKDFCARDHGYILNVCSSAGFFAGPNMASYYATKNYVTKLTLAISYELKKLKSHVVVSAFCPGPVDTEFEMVAKGKFKAPLLDSYKASKYAIDKLFKKKNLIVAGKMMKLGLFFSRFLPLSWLLTIIYYIQERKLRVK